MKGIEYEYKAIHLVKGEQVRNVLFCSINFIFQTFISIHAKCGTPLPISHFSTPPNIPHPCKHLAKLTYHFCLGIHQSI